jgi:nicotinate-nucleotide pyrophosphorylase (carboxylating)
MPRCIRSLLTGNIYNSSPFLYNETMNLERTCLRKIVRLALAEDRVDCDVTTDSLPEYDGPASARVIAKAAGVISGLEAFVETFRMIDDTVVVRIDRVDGSEVRPGEVIAEIEGRQSSILKAERTALNFLQHLSGVATLTRRFVEKIKPCPPVLLDTRKTTPGLRYLEKKAVRDGNGSNHRLNLEQMALIKDNHIEMAGSIAAAVGAVRMRHPEKEIEVEVRTLDELGQALAVGVEMIMLDNFDSAMIDKAVGMAGKNARLEISGNVDLDHVGTLARSGVDFISVGALTHSAPALDISLKISGK